MATVVELATELYQGLLFVSPAFFANTVATYTSGIGKIDRGKKFLDGKAWLGSHKSNGGFLGGILSGGFLGIAAPLFFVDIFARAPDYHWWLGLVMGFAAMLGDAIGSFIKRRFKFKPGQSFPVMDQIGFVVVTFLLIAPFTYYPPIWAWIVIPSTLFIHLGANTIAYLFGWKDVPW